MVDDSYFPPSPISNAFSTHMMSNYQPHSGSNSNTLETQTKKISEKSFSFACISLIQSPTLGAIYCH